MNGPHRFAVLAVATACAVGGFLLGRVASAPDPARGLAATTPDAGRDADTATPSARGVPVPLSDAPGSPDTASLQRANTTLRGRVAELERQLADAEPVIQDATEHDEVDLKPSPEGARAQVAKLRAAMASGDEDAVKALTNLLKFERAHAVPELLRMLETTDSIFAKEQLARMLGRLGDTRALPALHQMLEREVDDTVRTALVGALGGIRDPSSVALLTKEFARDSSSPLPPSIAATSLGRIGNDDAITALKTEITDGSNRMVRAFALRALADRQLPALSEFFLAQARRPSVNDRFRKQAIEAVASAKNPDARWELDKIAFDPDASKGVQEAAKRAVNALAGKTVYDVE